MLGSRSRSVVWDLRIMASAVDQGGESFENKLRKSNFVFELVGCFFHTGDLRHVE